MSLIPPEQGIDLLNGYLQDEIRLAETVSLSLGARLEQSRFSGSTFQPAAQLLWTPSDRQSVWASASRALRTPSRGEQGFSVSLGVIPTGLVGNPLPVSVTTLGKKDMRSEILHSYEAGYRNQLSTRLSLDVAAYYYNYSQLRAVTAAGGPYLVFVPIPHIQMVFQTANGGYSTNWGGELTANLKVSDRWRLFATYSRLQQRQKFAPNMWNAAMANMPHNLATVRSQTDLGQRLSFDTDLYFSGKQFDGLGGNKDLLLSTIQSNPLAELDMKPGNYLRWDARLTWRISPNWELTAGGENLLDKYHKELEPEMLMVGSLVKRSLFVRLIWRH